MFQANKSVPRGTIADRLIALFAIELDARVDLTTEIDSIDCDSLDWLQFLIIVEEEFSVSLPRMARFESVADILRWLEAPE